VGSSPWREGSGEENSRKGYLSEPACVGGCVEGVHPLACAYTYKFPGAKVRGAWCGGGGGEWEERKGWVGVGGWVFFSRVYLSVAVLKGYTVRTYLHARAHTRTYLSVQGQLGLHVGTSLKVGTPRLSHLAVGHHISKVKVVPNSMCSALTPLPTQGPREGNEGGREKSKRRGCEEAAGGRQHGAIPHVLNVAISDGETFATPLSGCHEAAPLRVETQSPLRLLVCRSHVLDSCTHAHTRG
jgi:hypothetical protein